MITLSYDGKKYILEYTRKTVSELENSGFVLGDISRKPVTLVPLLFAGAFKAHHRFIKPDIIEEIFGNTKNREKLIDKLIDMYAETYATLMEEPDEGNATWEEN